MPLAISISAVESFDKAFHIYFPYLSETMNMKKLLIRESLLFIAYMWFGFLIFPAGLVVIYMLVGGASKTYHLQASSYISINHVRMGIGLL
jgi:hypothetical protein